MNKIVVCLIALYIGIIGCVNDKCILYNGRALSYDTANSPEIRLGFTQNGLNGTTSNQCADLAEGLVGSHTYLSARCICKDNSTVYVGKVEDRMWLRFGAYPPSYDDLPPLGSGNNDIDVGSIK